MAVLPTVIAVNQTGTDIFISDLGLEVPASGQLNLTELAAYFEITGSEDLCTLVDDGDILINDGTSTLDTVRSLLYLDATGNVNAPNVAPSTQTIPVFDDGTGRFLRNTSVTIDPSNNLNLGSGNLVTTGTVGGIDLQNHASRHENGGADEIEAGNLKESRTPTNYTGGPTLDDHLSGIDDELGILSDELDNALGDLATVTVENSTGVSNIPTTWTDLSFDTTLLQNDTTVIEHGTGPLNDRITVKESGVYLFSWNFSCDDELQVRLRRNDTTVIAGPYEAGDPNDTNDVVIMNSVSHTIDLTANDFLTIQIQASTTAENLFAGGTFMLTRMRGPKGDQGDPGTGGDIEVEDDGTPVTGSPFSTLNFTGDGVSVSDGGSGTADITINAFSPNIFQARNTANFIITTGGDAIPLNAEDFKDSFYTHSNVTNNSRVTVNQTGIYKIYFSVAFDTTANARRTLSAGLRLNGTTEIIPSRGYGYARNNTDENAQASGQAFVSLTSGDFIEIFAQSVGSNGSLGAIADQQWLLMEFVR